MHIKKNILTYLLIAVVLPLCFSCKKNLITTSHSAKLTFQEDTVKFDTVFTTQGSATQQLKIYNPNNEIVNITNIRLAGGAGSLFRINVDGTSTYSINNVQIAAHDSMYIFVAVTVNPNNLSNPFIVTDSILFTTNGNDQKVILNAYGQNAHFYNDSVVCDVEWKNDGKPYVIINSLLVDSTCKLIIDPGVRVYMHYGSSIYVAGTLIVGPGATAQDSVVFQVDRLEQEYEGVPGQWGGIVFLRNSTGNSLTHAVINEASSGIIAGDLLTADTCACLLSGFNSINASVVTLNGCIIKNCLVDGINSLCSNITATNTLIYSCGMNDIGIFEGGTYNFYNCTFVDSNSAYINHNNPVVFFANYEEPYSVPYPSPLSANFYNTIVYGDISNGDEIDTASNSHAAFNYLFQNCLITTKLKTPSLHYNANLINENPYFVNAPNSDYHLESNSPCIGAGNPSFEPTYDLDGNLRGGSADIGCYEHH